MTIITPAIIFMIMFTAISIYMRFAFLEAGRWTLSTSLQKVCESEKWPSWKDSWNNMMKDSHYGGMTKLIAAVTLLYCRTFRGLNFDVYVGNVLRIDFCEVSCWHESNLEQGHNTVLCSPVFDADSWHRIKSFGS